MNAVVAGLLLLLVVCEGDGKGEKMFWGLGDEEGLEGKLDWPRDCEREENLLGAVQSTTRKRPHVTTRVEPHTLARPPTTCPTYLRITA